MAQDLTPPDPAIILDLVEGFRRSKILFACVSLGVFDSLSDGPKSLEALAAELPADQDALERLLNAGVNLGLLLRDDQGYANTPAAGAYLSQHGPQRLTGYIQFSNQYLWPLWSHLEDAVREGTHRWMQAFGWDGAIFSNFFRSEDAKREFLIGMHGYGLISSPKVVAAFDLGGYKTLADLGGATGHLAVAACERYPNLRGIVFDLPEAVPLAREMIGKSAVANRVEVIAGDFFRDPLPPADVYALGRILHDWSEPKVLSLLARIHAALPSGGGILLAEKLLDEDKRGPRWAHLQSLNMLVCTEGKERTLTEYEQLLVQCGFSGVRGYRTGASLDAVFARKA